MGTIEKSGTKSFDPCLQSVTLWISRRSVEKAPDWLKSAHFRKSLDLTETFPEDDV